MHAALHVDFWEMILRATVTFIVLLALARLLGKKQLSHLTFFNYVTGITIGSIAADIAGESKTPFLNGLTSLIWWSFLTICIGYFGMKSSKARVLFDGEPTILIKEGKIIKTALQRLRLNLDDLSMLLREKDVFSVKDVHYAVLEPNGILSILKKEQQQAVTKSDLKIPSSPFVFLPSEIICDGKIVYKNLRELDLTEEWVRGELKKQGIHSVAEVFYAEVQQDGTLHINS